MLSAIFFKNENGVEPVKDWMTKDLNFDDRKIIFENIATLQRGFPNVNMPLVRRMGQGLYELRCHITGKRIVRIFFCHSDVHLILLHGFVKKTETTPAKDLKLSKSRKDKL
jgi:phage-related protein